MLSPNANALLHKIVEVETWVRSGDPRGNPYLDAHAVRLINGKVAFEPRAFNDVLIREEPQWAVILFPANDSLD